MASDETSGNQKANTAPVVQSAAFSMREDGTLLITAEQLLAGSHDDDNDVITVTNVSVDPQYGSVTPGSTKGTWAFKPNPDSFGQAVLTYTASDGTNSVSQSIEVGIQPSNDAPVAKPVTFTMRKNDTLVMPAEKILANSYDADNDELRVTNVSVDAQYGTVTDNNDDTWTFTPAKNCPDKAKLSFVITDGNFPVASTITVEFK